MSSSITGLVASFNEGHLLETCLPSLQFCDQTLLVNLESTDSTAAVAKKFHAKIIDHVRVPVVEMIHFEVIPTIKSKWVIILDPDEEVEPELSRELIKLAGSKSAEKAGIVYVPFQFYFKRKKLTGGIWGGIKTKRLMLRREGINLSPNVHLGTTLKSDYKDHYIQFTGKNLVHHYWMDSYSQLFEKHRRYIAQEGKARYEQGHRFKHVQLVKAPLFSFYEAYISKRGYRDRLTGLFLAFFWAWYNYKSRVSLKQYQKQMRSSNA